MHWKRWLTALVLIPPLVLLFLKGSPALFAMIVCVANTLCLWEYYRVAFHGNIPKVPFIFEGWGYLCGAMVLAAAHAQNLMALILVLVLAVIGATVMSILRFKISTDAPLVAVKQIFGVLYISVFISFLILLRYTTDGPVWVLFLFWVIAWGDTGALYTGTLWGATNYARPSALKKPLKALSAGWPPTWSLPGSLKSCSWVPHLD
jgi:CDP-diglyceride synthetase